MAAASTRRARMAPMRTACASGVAGWVSSDECDLHDDPAGRHGARLASRPGVPPLVGAVVSDAAAVPQLRSKRTGALRRFWGPVVTVLPAPVHDVYANGSLGSLRLQASVVVPPGPTHTP